LVLLSAGGETTNAGHYWGTLTGIREAGCCNRTELLSGVLLYMIMPDHSLLAPQGSSGVLAGSSLSCL